MAATKEEAAKSKAQALREEMAEVFKKHGGKVSKEDVVAWAMGHKKGAIHAFLESRGCFDGERAKKRLQLIAAGFLLRTIRVVINDEQVGPVRVRYTTSLGELRGPGKPSYVQTDVARASDAMRQGMMDDALRDLKAFLAKYRTIAGLAGLVGEAEKFIRFAVAGREDGKERMTA